MSTVLPHSPSVSFVDEILSWSNLVSPDWSLRQLAKLRFIVLMKLVMFFTSSLRDVSSLSLSPTRPNGVESMDFMPTKLHSPDYTVATTLLAVIGVKSVVLLHNVDRIFFRFGVLDDDKYLRSITQWLRGWGLGLLRDPCRFEILSVLGFSSWEGLLLRKSAKDSFSSLRLPTMPTGARTTIDKAYQKSTC